MSCMPPLPYEKPPAGLVYPLRIPYLHVKTAVPRPREASRGISMRSTVSAVSTSILIGLTVVGVAEAQWIVDGTPICLADGDQDQPAITSDGAGGAIVVWRDRRDGNGDIYVQGIDAEGDLSFGNSVALCDLPSIQDHPAICSDEAGGAIVAWGDGRLGAADIFAQRVDGQGEVLWTVYGKAVASSNNSGPPAPAVFRDHCGGAFVIWRDGFVEANPDFSLGIQRLDADGHRILPLPYVTIPTHYPLDWTLLADGTGGGFVAWSKVVGSWPGWYAAVVQRISPAGEKLWGAEGIEVATGFATIDNVQLVSDQSEGTIVVWNVLSERYPEEIRAQRVNCDGMRVWLDNGVTVATAVSGRPRFHAVSDGVGGAVVVWVAGFDSNTSLHGQRISAAGEPLWGESAVLVATNLPRQAPAGASTAPAASSSPGRTHRKTS